MSGHPGHHRAARAGTWVLAAFLLLALLPAGGCAVMSDPADKEAVAEFNEINDPAEPTNRAVFGVNRGLDAALLKPVATADRDATPQFFQDRINDALDNLTNERGQYMAFNTDTGDVYIHSSVGGVVDAANLHGYRVGIRPIPEEIFRPRCAVQITRHRNG